MNRAEKIFDYMDKIKHIKNPIKYKDILKRQFSLTDNEACQFIIAKAIQD